MFRELVKMLLEIPTLDVNATGKEGVTALSLACLQGDLDIVQMLLARLEINVNRAVVAEDSVSPLTVSIFKNHLAVTNLLLEREDLELLDDQDNNGLNPLHVATAKGEAEVVRRLIQFGCDVDKKSNNSFTAIPVAMIKCPDEDR